MGIQSSTGLRVVLVTALVVLAGCSGVFGSDGGTDTPDTDSMSPAPVSPGAGTDTGTAAAEYPPGIGPDGITNVSALLAAHRSLLENQSYTVTMTSNRTSRSNIDNRFAVEGKLTFVQYVRSNESDWKGVEYVGPAGYANRQYLPHNGSVSAASGSPERVEMSPQLRRMGVFWGLVEPGYRLRTLADDASVSRVERDGTTFYRLANNRTTVYVRTDGLIKTIVTLSALEEERFSYRDIGNTTVTPPDWARRAIRNGTETATDAGTPPENGTAAPTS